MKHPDGSVTVAFKVAFRNGPHGRRQVVSPKPVALQEKPPIDPSSVPRITRMLVLGHHFERLVHGGVVKDFIEISRLTGLSKSRVTQIANLTLLSPALQSEILRLRTGDTVCYRLNEHHVPCVITNLDWRQQRVICTSTR